MLTVLADAVNVEDGDTLQIQTDPSLVFDLETNEAWPVGYRDVNTDKQRYDVREHVWLRLQNLDTHESYTVAGEEETAAFEDWLDNAESQWDADMYELEVFSPGTDVFQLGSYGRLLGMMARRCDGDDWETSVLTKFGNSVAWREQTPK